MKSIFKRKRCTFDTPKTFYSFWKKSTFCILYTETCYNLQADKNFRKQSVSRIKIVNNVFLNWYIVCSKVGSLHWLTNEIRVQKNPLRTLIFNKKEISLTHQSKNLLNRLNWWYFMYLSIELHFISTETSSASDRQGSTNLFKSNNISLIPSHDDS